MTITLDNTFSNISAVRILKIVLTPSFSDHFHIKCACHIYNLVVKDGIKLFEDILAKIQFAINYIYKNNRIQRLREYKKTCHDCGIAYRKVPKEVCTR